MHDPTRGQRPGRPAAPQRPRLQLPPVIAFALVMLGMCVLIGLIAGFAVIARQPAVGAALLVFGLVALATAWQLARGTPLGYWAAVSLLGLVGGVPGGIAAAHGAVAATVTLAAPFVVALILLRPSIRAGLIRPRTSDEAPAAREQGARH
jgi:hypothetical protein